MRDQPTTMVNQSRSVFGVLCILKIDLDLESDYFSVSFVACIICFSTYLLLKKKKKKKFLRDFFSCCKLMDFCVHLCVCVCVRARVETSKFQTVTRVCFLYFFLGIFFLFRIFVIHLYRFYLQVQFGQRQR